MSRSQLGQDIMVLKALNNKQNGFFVEVGAADGIHLSNTFLLENEYNWKGICVEPNTEFFESLKKNRKCQVSNACLFETAGLSVEFNNHHLYSGIVECVDHHTHTLNSGRRETKTTSTLSDVLDACEAPLFIDYLSLDTEGSELSILKGVDLTKYTFGILHIEHNHVEPRRSQIKTFLIDNGYVFVGDILIDDIYMHSSLSST